MTRYDFGDANEVNYSRALEEFRRHLQEARTTFRPRVEVTTEPLIGWRAWDVNAHRGVLYSIYQDTLWPSRTALVAPHICRSGYMDATGPSHVCGIHAFRSRDLAASLVRAFGPERMGAYGTVSLWGRVFEHERGFRAEFAYPYEIVLRGPNNATTAELMKRLRDRYGVDVLLEVETAAHTEAQFRSQLQYLQTTLRSRKISPIVKDFTG